MLRRSTNVTGRVAGVGLLALCLVPGAASAGAGPAGPAGIGSPAVTAAPPSAARRPPAKESVAIGYDGAVATVDADASAAGIGVLRRGGNAVDAAVAAAAALGVTEPYSAGIGGGGFLLYYEAKTGRVYSVDGRETAPRRMTSTAFVEHGRAIPFEEAVTSGLSVGVPGTPLTWHRALQRWGTLSLAEALEPATRLAREGFVVDETFRAQAAENAERFAAFTSTRDLFLPGGAPPAVGTVFRNPGLARTHEGLARHGVEWLYRGGLGADVAAAAAHPPVVPGSPRKVRPGLMTRADLAAYTAPYRAPTSIGYRGLTVYGMGPPSSGGSTVGEALNILERFPLSALSRTRANHLYLEASALAFADRNRYVGDPRVDVPLRELLSDGFARERACRIDPHGATTKPVRYGSPDGSYPTRCPRATAGSDRSVARTGSTTHLTTADKWGNVAAYTLTIEQTGGSGIVVPGRGFLLNNELTDFNFVSAYPDGRDPNLPAPGKRPRSSMSPTILLADGEPFLALGSPGGSTIITTVLQTLVNRLELGYSLPRAIAAPRATQRNTPDVVAEPAFDTTALTRLGHSFTRMPEIGAATGIEFLDGGAMLAAAEPRRRGGGSAEVVRPRR